MFDWLYKIWRNPWDCKRCLDTYRNAWEAYPDGQFDFIYVKSGFNKGHRHGFKATEYPLSFKPYLDDHKKFFNDLNKEMERIKKEMALTLTGQPGQWYWHVHHQVLA